ncbi:MAG: glycosyltransferase [Polyangiales bacterium]
MYEVNISARSMDPFIELLGKDPIVALSRRAESIRATLGSRVIWNINSTAAGGGVAEMLRPLLRYARGFGVNARWLVIEGPPDFFRITKRIHNALHGNAGDGSVLGPEQTALYEKVMHENIVGLDALVRPGDIVICHDPQTAGLAPHLMRKGCRVVWRCHIGHETHDGEVDLGWRFLRPYLEKVSVAVFSRGAYAPAWLSPKRTAVLAPNIDPFSAKNQPLDDATIRAILVETGLIEGPPGTGAPTFTRDDGSKGRVDRKAEVIRIGRPTAWETPLVVQVSRWDAMKDPIGVMQGFARFLEPEAPRGAELILAGPNVQAVADDPEGSKVFSELEAAWRALPDSLRAPVHLALLPMDDNEENAAIVNALQRHAAIIVQKSLMEGFGLTVTEAMWKRRPVVASAVGGIQDQIRDGVDGILLQDPRDLKELGAALARILSDAELASRLGLAAYERVCDQYLVVTALDRWADLLENIIGRPEATAPRTSSLSLP